MTSDKSTGIVEDHIYKFVTLQVNNTNKRKNRTSLYNQKIKNEYYS